MELIIILDSWYTEQNTIVKYNRIPNHSQELSGTEEISYLGNFVPRSTPQMPTSLPSHSKWKNIGTFSKMAEIPRAYQPEVSLIALCRHMGCSRISKKGALECMPTSLSLFTYNSSNRIFLHCLRNVSSKLYPIMASC